MDEQALKAKYRDGWVEGVFTRQIFWHGMAMRVLLGATVFCFPMAIITNSWKFAAVGVITMAWAAIHGIIHGGAIVKLTTYNMLK